MTKAFETACLRHMWWPFRTHIRAPSRKSDYPKEFELKRINVTSYDEKTTLIAYDEDTVTRMPAAEYPPFYYAFTFKQAGLLSGVPSINTDHSCFCLIEPEAINKLLLNNKQGFRLGPGNWDQFCKLIAKISHSYAIAELGYKSFTPYLHSYIRGKQPITIFDYIGCAETPAKSDAFHEIGIRAVHSKNLTYIVVELRLFSFLDTPTYEIVVGHLDCSFKEFSLLTKPLYAINVKAPLPGANLRPMRFDVRGTGG